MPPADAFDGFAIDLDGVIWLAGEPIPGSVEAVAKLRRRGAGVVFVTNDPGRTTPQTAELLSRVGIAAGPDDVVTSAATVAEQIRVEHGEASVYLIGPPALREQLEMSGLRVVG